jgi:site-specific DNA recombinase
MNMHNSTSSHRKENRGIQIVRTENKRKVDDAKYQLQSQANAAAIYSDMKTLPIKITQHPGAEKDDEKPIFAAVYARVSPGKKANGYSLEEQVRLAKEHCDRHGWKVRYVFTDNNVSGANIDREKFQLMMRKARQQAFTVISFWKIDRFARSLADLVNIERELRTYNVSLSSVTEPVDTVSSIGRFSFRNIASAAELERDLIQERTKMGMHALAMKNRWPNRTPPLGYNIEEDHTLIINQQGKKLVIEIFRMYLRLRSMSQVAFELNIRGLQTRRKKRWTNMSVKQILDNEIYIGKYNVAGVEAYIKELRIISDKLFNKAKNLRNRYEEKPKAITEERRLTTIQHVFNEYLVFLDDMEYEENTDIM